MCRHAEFIGSPPVMGTWLVARRGSGEEPQGTYPWRASQARRRLECSLGAYPGMPPLGHWACEFDGVGCCTALPMVAPLCALTCSAGEALAPQPPRSDFITHDNESRVSGVFIPTGLTGSSAVKGRARLWAVLSVLRS